MSQSIKKLENELGITILLRDKTGISFTSAGNEVLSYAKDVLNKTTLLHDKLIELQTQVNIPEKPTLRISSASSVLNTIFPKIIKKSYFKEIYSNISISLANSIDTLLHQIAYNEVDIGFVSTNEIAFQSVYNAYRDILDMKILLQDETIAVMDRKYYDDNNQVYDIKKYDINQPRTVYNVVAYDLSIYDPINLVCSTDANFHRSMMEHAGAVTYMSKFAYNNFFTQKKYIPLSIHDMDVPLIHAIIYRKPANPNILKLQSCLQEEMKK